MFLFQKKKKIVYGIKEKKFRICFFFEKIKKRDALLNKKKKAHEGLFLLAFKPTLTGKHFLYNPITLA